MTTNEDIHLSFNVSKFQQRFYIEWKLDPNSSKYNLYFSYKIKGEIDLSLIEYSLKLFLKKNPILKSSFSQKNNYVFQHIYQDIDFELEIMDGRNETNNKKESYVRDYLNKPFDLEKPILFKSLLIKLSDDNHQLICVWHHILGDASLEKKFISDFSDCYNYYKNSGFMPKINSKFSPEENTSIAQYIDYINYINQLSIEEDKQYWLKILSQHSNYIEIPKIKNDLKPISTEADSCFFDLDLEKTNKFNTFINLHKISKFKVLATAYAITLNRYTDQLNFLLNFPINVRPSNAIELQGSWVNNLILQISLDNNLTFLDLINDIAIKSNEAIKHNMLCFTDLINILREKNIIDNSEHIFNVSIAETYLGKQVLPLEGVTAIGEGYSPKALFNDLSLGYQIINNQLNFRLTYRKSLWNKEFAKQFKNHFIKVLNVLLNNPEQKISEFNILSSSEYKKIVYDWNKTVVKFPRDKNITQLFEIQVKKTPNNIALIHKGKSFSYEEINQLANKLGNYIKKSYSTAHSSKLPPETKICVCLEHGTHLITSLLAVLKIGGAYIPIDPDYPLDRIESIIVDSKAAIIITNKIIKQKIFQNNLELDANFIIIDISNKKTQKEINKCSNTNIISLHKPNTLAYIIYTSGSTGKPKGVLIEQRGIINHLFWLYNYLLAGSLRFTDCSSSIAFDFTVPVIFTPLITGNTLVMCPKDIKFSLDSYLNYLEENKITFIKVTPSYLQLISNKNHKFKYLKCILSAGENLPKKICKDILRINPNLKIYNDYGPTEISVAATAYEFNNQENLNNYVPIGKPISNAKIYILNKFLKPVPIGVLGELYISGVGVGRGYLNQITLTNKNFIENPFNKHSKNEHNKDYLKLYKTGDLCYWLPNGNIQYVGRIDHQIKIRGYRIEPEEISAKLVLSGLVEQAIILQKEINNNKVLVAYIVPSNKFRPINDKEVILKDYLAAHLPLYMVPYHYIVVDKLPLTTNGKIDKKLLPEVIEIKNSINISINDSHISLLRICKDVFSIDNINLSDNFFSIGGDSLKAITIIDRIKKEFNVVLSVKEIYKYPILQNLAERITLENEKEEYIDYKNEINNITTQHFRPYIPTYERNIYKPLEILITGGSGYLGVHIIHYLINHHRDCHIYCILRSNSDFEAIKKLQNSINNLHGWNLRYRNKLTAISGDLSKPLFGLNRKTYDLLAKKIDTIIHSAAHVDHFHSYDFLYKTNVAGMFEVIKFSNHIKMKEIHSISTTGIFSENKYYELYDENSLINNEKHLRSNGYDGSKWVADHACQDIRKNGQFCAVYRTSLLIPGELPVFPKYNWVGDLVMICHKIKAIPTFLQYLQVPVICVDDVAKFITENVINKKLKHNNNFHLWVNKSGFFNKIANSFLKQEAFKLLSTKDWISCYDNYFSKNINENRPILALIESVRTIIEKNKANNDDELIKLLACKKYFNPTYYESYSNKLTLNILNKFNIQLTQINDNFIERIITHNTLKERL